MSYKEFSVAEAKKHLSEILGRVAYGGERIVITKRGKPLAMVVPPTESTAGDHLSQVEGWLDESDAFFDFVARIVRNRDKHIPRGFDSPRE